MPVSISRALDLATRHAESIQLPPEMAALDIRLHRADLLMIAGRPGAGKSTFAGWLDWRMGLPSLVFSADQSPREALSQMASRVTGHTSDEVAEGLLEHGQDFYRSALRAVPMEFCFDNALDPDAIEAELDAYVEIHDRWPEVVLIDHLNKMEGSENYEGQKWLLGWLHSLARDIEALVIILHHASMRNHKDFTQPAPVNEIENKVTHYPDAVISVALDDETGDFWLAKVKARGVKADPGAKHPVRLSADPSRSTYAVARPSAVTDWWKENVS
jgi:hypothetical protein